jgi:hypothetical protein
MTAENINLLHRVNKELQEAVLNFSLIREFEDNKEARKHLTCTIRCINTALDETKELLLIDNLQNLKP